MLCGPSLRSSAYRQWPHARRVRRAVSALAASLWGESRVTYVRNITDVDDKINARAAELSVDIRALTNEMIAIFHADAKALGCLEPTIEPRATDHIAPMLDIIGKLIDRGHAYAAEGHVLFDVPSDPEGCDSRWLQLHAAVCLLFPRELGLTFALICREEACRRRRKPSSASVRMLR
jgi:cysteinyl-tRNA synthetase